MIVYFLVMNSKWCIYFESPCSPVKPMHFHRLAMYSALVRPVDAIIIQKKMSVFLNKVGSSGV